MSTDTIRAKYDIGFDDGKTEMTIYYKQSQLSELTIFITQLLKQFKQIKK